MVIVQSSSSYPTSVGYITVSFQLGKAMHAMVFRSVLLMCYSDMPSTCCVGSDPYTSSSRAFLHKSYGITFFISLRSIIALTTSSLGTGMAQPLGSLARKPSNALVLPLCSRLPVTVSLGPDEVMTKREESNRNSPDAIPSLSQDHSSSGQKGSPASLGVQASAWSQPLQESLSCGRRGKQKTKHYKTKKGFPCALSDPKGPPFCLCRPERGPLESSFCLHLVCSSGFLAAFETTPGDARGKKETGNHGCFSGILSPSFLFPFTC